MSNETDSKRGSAAQEEKPKLKVTDRRMFDTDGNLRQPDGDPPESRDDAPSSPVTPPVEEGPKAAPAPDSAAPAADPSAAASADDSGSALFTQSSSAAPAAAPSAPAAPTLAGKDTGPAAAGEDLSPAPDGKTEQAPGGSYADLPRGFAPFVESQYLEALIFLGEVPHPQTGETIEDPEFARYKIDLLTMIQEKTEGNLTDEESRLIEDVLYQLRMLFVQKTSPAAP